MNSKLAYSDHQLSYLGVHLENTVEASCDSTGSLMKTPTTLTGQPIYPYNPFSRD